MLALSNVSQLIQAIPNDENAFNAWSGYVLMMLETYAENPEADSDFICTLPFFVDSYFFDAYGYKRGKTNKVHNQLHIIKSIAACIGNDLLVNLFMLNISSYNTRATFFTIDSENKFQLLPICKKLFLEMQQFITNHHFYFPLSKNDIDSEVMLWRENNSQKTVLLAAPKKQVSQMLKHLELQDIEAKNNEMLWVAEEAFNEENYDELKKRCDFYALYGEILIQRTLDEEGADYFLKKHNIKKVLYL